MLFSGCCAVSVTPPVGVKAELGRQVERHAEAARAVREQLALALALVVLLRARIARILAVIVIQPPWTERPRAHAGAARRGLSDWVEPDRRAIQINRPEPLLNEILDHSEPDGLPRRQRQLCNPTRRRRPTLDVSRGTSPATASRG